MCSVPLSSVQQPSMTLPDVSRYRSALLPVNFTANGPSLPFTPDSTVFMSISGISLTAAPFMAGVSAAGADSVVSSPAGGVSVTPGSVTGSVGDVSAGLPAHAQSVNVSSSAVIAAKQCF